MQNEMKNERERKNQELN